MHDIYLEWLRERIFNRQRALTLRAMLARRSEEIGSSRQKSTCLLARVESDDSTSFQSTALTHDWTGH